MCKWRVLNCCIVLTIDVLHVWRLLSLSMISSSDILPFFFCLSAAFEAESPSVHVLGAGMGSITERVYTCAAYQHNNNVFNIEIQLENNETSQRKCHKLSKVWGHFKLKLKLCAVYTVESHRPTTALHPCSSMLAFILHILSTVRTQHKVTLAFINQND